MKALAACAALSVAAAGCTHNYLYSADAPPTVERGELVVPTRTGDERYDIRRLGVTTREQPFAFRAPTSDELALLNEGVVPDHLNSVRVEVNNAGALWRDYGLVGFGIGASLVLGGFGLLNFIDPGAASSSGITLPLVFLIASIFGTEFMLLGLGYGVAFESGQTDMRYRKFADE